MYKYIFGCMMILLIINQSNKTQATTYTAHPFHKPITQEQVVTKDTYKTSKLMQLMYYKTTHKPWQQDFWPMDLEQIDCNLQLERFLTTF